MDILFLGTGTSHGIPVIGCHCSTCSSTNEKNKRLRSSVLVSIDEKHILIDTSIDFRQQALRYRIDRVDAILFTHHHVDHIFGLDDTRVFNKINKKKIPCYGAKPTIKQLKHIYSYIFDYPDIPGGIPMLEFVKLDSEPFDVEEIIITPIEIMHGNMPINAYRIGNAVYATDCSFIPEHSMEKFSNADVLILDCLRIRKHPTHFNLEQALEITKKINAKQTYFTHMSHEIEHETISKTLPHNVALAYDGLKITL
jgi:phosphoribosyl 1,2-cyclic phosphate phosphodiesterase